MFDFKNIKNFFFIIMNNHIGMQDLIWNLQETNLAFGENHLERIF